MKLTTEYFFNNGEVNITEQGWIELRCFCESIVFKRVGAKPYTEDLISQALIKCAEKIPEYDWEKNNALGGFLYFTVLGVISIAANKAKREIPFDFTKEGTVYV